MRSLTVAKLGPRCSVTIGAHFFLAAVENSALESLRGAREACV